MADYDAAERHRRYLRERELIGRPNGLTTPSKAPRKPPSVDAFGNVHPDYAKHPERFRSPPVKASSKSTDTQQEAKARVSRIKGKISSLEGALTEALSALAELRRSAAKTEKESSDGKTTVAERTAAKESRDKNQTKNAAEAKKANPPGPAGGGSSAKSTSTSSTTSKPTVESLQARVTKIRSALVSAKKQLSAAQSTAGLSHSDTSAVELRLDAPIQRKESVQMTDADFGGYATRHGVPCADGRTILPGAFEKNDGMYVPLVYSHDRSDINNVLGRVKLESRDDGVYAHAYFNETANGQTAKQQVQHGDLTFLSIFANQLKERAKVGMQHAKEVIEGNIREVSLVVAGANPGAYIDVVNLAHTENPELGIDVDEAVITSGIEIELEHAAPADEKTKDDETEEEDEDGSAELQRVLATYNDEQKAALNFLLSEALAHEDTDPDLEADPDPEAGTDDTETGDDAVSNPEANPAEEPDPEAAAASEQDPEAGADVQHDNTQEDNSMTHNLFDQAGKGGSARPQITLTADEVNTIVHSAMDSNSGKLSEAVRDFVKNKGVTVDGELKHGIENIDYLFPDAQLLENSPAFISRRMEWVDKVLSSVRKSPFSRIKTITADITPDEARARGYIKGNMKNEEFFALSKRETTPQTVYKKQKLDRDDVVDIVNLDVVAWLKAEMKVMLDEEIAGAILVGDGRSIGDDDKIKETNIRPIASDAELYVTTAWVNLDDAESSVEELVDSVINNRRYYKGTGQPTFFTTEGTISSFLTVKDNFGRRLYANLGEVAAVLRVSEIVPVEVMERVPDLVGIMVNLADYTLGADRGGQATMFDDFDIDYNKLRYLIETRLSGALTTPKAAIVFRRTAGNSVLRVPAEPTFENNVVTVPTVTGVVYKNADGGATLTTASPVTLADGQSLKVVATPTSGSHFANNAEDEWTYTNPVGP